MDKGIWSWSGSSTTHKESLSRSSSYMLMCFPYTHQLSDWHKYLNLCFFQMENIFFSNLESATYPSPIGHEDPTSFNNSKLV
jgi:hypothetical protein